MYVLMYVMPNKYNSKVLNIIKRGYLLQKIKIYTKHEHPGLLDIGCIGVLFLPIISGPSSYWASLPMRINHSLNLYIIFRHRVQPSNLKPLGELKIYYHLHKYTFTFHLSRESHMSFPGHCFLLLLLHVFSSLLNWTQEYSESQNSYLSSQEGRCPVKPNKRGGGGGWKDSILGPVSLSQF